MKKIEDRDFEIIKPAFNEIYKLTDVSMEDVCLEGVDGLGPSMQDTSNNPVST